jgi:hypothetical protein
MRGSAALRLTPAALAAAAVLGTGSLFLGAEEPIRLAHARVESRSAAAAGGLEASLRAAAPSTAWFGYSLPMPASSDGRRIRSGGDRSSSGWVRGECSLESGSSWVNVSDGEGDGGGGSAAVFFYRVESGRPSRLRVFSDDCTVDAGGTAVIWLDGVRAAESVALLEKLSAAADTGDGDRDRISRERVLMAIALHDDPSADAALERFASPSSPVSVRKKAVFWLGNARGERGLAVLKRMASSDPDESVRKSVTFALSQSPVEEAVDVLVSMARSDASPRVRSQALFWLAQKAGRRAAGTITEAIRDDPETEVKRKAVFALTQLPSDESVTELIRVARTNRNPEIRRQAFFWLGQSKDPRALAFFEDVLTR